MHTTPDGPPVTLLGDHGIAVTIGGPPGAAATTALVRAVADALRAAISAGVLPGIVDLVPAPNSVTLIYDILAGGEPHATAAAIRQLAGRALDSPPANQGRLQSIPVHYGGDAGPDLEDVCRASGLDRHTLIQRHTAAEYLVTAVGFTPGFAYLGGLDPALAVPRRTTPRRRVPAGSVGIGGAQTGIYPSASPGGWQIIGRTSAPLFDPFRPQPALLAVGDRVRFVEVPAEQVPPDDSTRVAAATEPGGDARRVSAATEAGLRGEARGLTILEPGLLASVQDLGRPGYRSDGITTGGAADAAAAEVANLLVGNPPTAAVLEATLLGPTIRFEQDTIVAMAGAEFPGLPSLRPVRITAGEVRCLGHATSGCRCCVAVAGGLLVPPVLGSRSTHLTAGFGGLAGRPLAAGDRIAFGAAGTWQPEDRWSLSPALLPLPPRPCRLRFLPASNAAACRDLVAESFRVTARSDRMGLRLAGRPLEATGDGVSRAVLPGTLQLPADGQPILLLADAQTIGGYPVLGHVISADLRHAAQLRPGDTVCFEQTTLDEAHRAFRRLRGTLDQVTGLIASRSTPG